MSLFTETAVLHYAGKPEIDDDGNVLRDDYGNPIIGEPTSEETPAWWEPRSSLETNTPAQDQIVSGYGLYLPLATSLEGLEKVTLPGVGEFEVDGEPGVQPGGYVVEGFISIALTKVSG